MNSQMQAGLTDPYLPHLVMSIMHELVRKTLMIFTGRMVGRAAQFFTFLLLARTLSPEDFGVYGLLITSVVLASLLGSIGLRQAGAHWIGTQKISQHDALRMFYKILPILIAISAAAVWIVLRNEFTGSPSIGAIVIFLALSGSMTVMVFQGVLLGLGRTTSFAISDSIYSLSLLVCIVSLYAVGHSDYILYVVIAVAFAQVCAAIVTFFLARKKSIETSAPPRPRLLSLIKHGFAYSINLFLITLSARISLYFIQQMISEDAVGQFFAGQRLGDLFVEAATAVGLVLFSDGVRSKAPQETLRRNTRVAACILWAFTVVGALFSLFASDLVTLIFAEGYTDAGRVLTITAWMIAPASATKLLYPAIAAMGRPVLGSPAILAAITVNVALCIALMPSHGIIGAAIALVVSQYTLFIAYVCVLKATFHIPLKDSLLPSFSSKGISQ